VREVLMELSSEVPISPEAAHPMRAALQVLDVGTPWYLRVLMAFGAWFGTWFLLSFVIAVLALPFGNVPEAAAIVIGLGLMGAAVALRHAVAHDFLQHVAVILSLTGQGMFIGGVGASTNALGPAAVAGLLISIVLIAVFPDRVHRFLSTVGAVVALVGLAYESRLPHATAAIAILLMALVLLLWRGAPLNVRVEQAEATGPIVSGAIISLFGLLLLSAIFDFMELRTATWFTQHGPTTAGAVLGLLWLVHEVLDDHRSGTFGVPALAASAAILALAAITWRTPAIAVTLLVIVLAFDRRSRTISALAIAFFLAFGALYYYNLQMTLLEKSAVLAGSGVLCLFAWAIIRRLASGEEEAAA
jgi:uncharacterized membrane protein